MISSKTVAVVMLSQPALSMILCKAVLVKYSKLASPAMLSKPALLVIHKAAPLMM